MDKVKWLWTYIKTNRKSLAEKGLAIFAVVCVYGILQLFGITCPIKFVTGISCCGCGMTRAYLALLHLDLAKAFYYHPLFVVPPIAIFIFLFKYKISIKFYRAIIFTICILFIIVYVWRLLDVTNDIVVFRPDQSIVYILYQYIKARF